jgi:hypothetical protein
MPATIKIYEAKMDGETIGELNVLNRVNRIIARLVVDGKTVASVDLHRVFRELTIYYISEENGYDHFTLVRKLVHACVTENPKILDGLKQVFVNEEIEYWGKEMKLSFPGLDDKPYPKCVRVQPEDDACRMRAPIMEVIGEEEEVENVKRVKIM